MTDNTAQNQSLVIMKRDKLNLKSFYVNFNTLCWEIVL